MVEIREAATGDDWAKARSLIEEYASSLGFDLGFQRFDEELASFPSPYVSPGGCILLVEIDGAAVGCVALRPIFDRVCEMKRLYVRPGQRGRGVGNSLVQALVEWACRAGYSKMRLDTLPHMVQANTLYASLGFREIPPYRPNPFQGALYLELDLQHKRP